jgi:putative endonuclease
VVFGEFAGFSKTRELKRLVYFERHDDILSAITREKAMKAWKRAWKLRLIMTVNPAWDDLYDRIV